MPLTIDNKTEWRTDDLRRLFTAGLRHIGIEERGRRVVVVYSRHGSVTGWGSYCGIHFEVVGPSWGRHRAAKGYHVKMRLPRPKWVPCDPLTGRVEVNISSRVARVWEHEVWHTMGRRHGEMHPSIRWCSQKTPWAAGKLLRLRAAAAPKRKKVQRQSRTVATDAAKTNPKLARALTRLRQADANLARWQKRLKAADRKYERADNAEDRWDRAIESSKAEKKVKEWERKRKRLTKRVAALTPQEFTAVAAAGETR